MTVATKVWHHPGNAARNSCTARAVLSPMTFAPHHLFQRDLVRHQHSELCVNMYAPPRLQGKGDPTLSYVVTVRIEKKRRSVSLVSSLNVLGNLSLEVLRMRVAVNHVSSCATASDPYSRIVQ